MNRVSILTRCTALLAALLLISAAWAGDHEHGAGEHAGHGAHEEGGGVVKLSAEQVRQAGIVTAVLQPRANPTALTAPGVVAFNAYALADITTRIDAVVHARHVRLGDRVRKGQPLATLNSTALAQAEAAYLKSRAEYQRSRQELTRLKSLAKQKIVSQARLQQAESDFQSMRAALAAARATLFSYGLEKEDIAALPEQSRYGLVVLRAPHAGTVVADDFRLGQHLAAGAMLMQVADESRVWVEMRISESALADIRVGQAAQATPKGGNAHYFGAVISIHHQLDRVTRTAGVRLEIVNRDDQLHPGMFVSAEIATDSGEPALLLPEQAVQRQGSELIVFVEEEPGHFERREVSIGGSHMGLVVVTAGVHAGEPVVVKGAFVLASELAKAGFEVHNH